MQKITVTLREADLIKSILKTNPKLDYEALIALIIEDAGVTSEIAELYAKSWRGLHDETGALISSKNILYVATPFPVSSKNPSAPKVPSADGTGIVAQIIKLAEEGKSIAEIIALGYNKSTTYRQVSEWKKRKKGGQ